MRSSRPILLVEDDRVDTMTVKRALKDLNVKNTLIHKPMGDEALEYLKNDNNVKPCVIFLDLNTPKMNGIEFIKIIKANDECKKIPVVVLTTSKHENDVNNSFELSVAGYIVKSADYKKFVEAIKTVNLYWTLSELPDGE